MNTKLTVLERGDSRAIPPTPWPLVQPRPTMARAVAAEAADVPVEAGEIIFRGRVRLDWALAQ
jgi:uncharacterized protein YggE